MPCLLCGWVVKISHKERRGEFTPTPYSPLCPHLQLSTLLFISAPTLNSPLSFASWSELRCFYMRFCFKVCVYFNFTSYNVQLYLLHGHLQKAQFGGFAECLVNSLDYNWKNFLVQPSKVMPYTNMSKFEALVVNCWWAGIYWQDGLQYMKVWLWICWNPNLSPNLYCSWWARRIWLDFWRIVLENKNMQGMRHGCWKASVGHNIYRNFIPPA